MRGEFILFLDRLTENPVARLTTPSYAAFLARPEYKCVSKDRKYLWCASDRSGSMAIHRIDLKNGSVQHVVDAPQIASGCFSLDSNRLLFLDGSDLREVGASGGQPKTVANGIDAFTVTHGIVATISANKLQNNSGQTVTTEAESPLLLSPNGDACLFARASGAEYWVSSLDPTAKPVRVAQGQISSPAWSADSTTVFFLRTSNSGGVSLSAVSVRDRREIPVGPTSKYAVFSCNSDDTVFVGASASRAQPLISVLLHATGRELPLCEHRTSSPASANPIFSPDNRRVYFQSDREGKSAIYSVNTELVVDPA